MPTGEQKQKKRTYDVLPKPDKLIRCRQRMFGRVSLAHDMPAALDQLAPHGLWIAASLKEKSGAWWNEEQGAALIVATAASHTCVFEK
jgi:hypothetical protein